MSDKRDFFLTCYVVAASAAAGVSVEAMRGGNRRAGVVRPRQVAMAGAHAAGYPMTEIGAAFNRDHTTVFHALKRQGVK